MINWYWCLGSFFIGLFWSIPLAWVLYRRLSYLLTKNITVEAVRKDLEDRRNFAQSGRDTKPNANSGKPGKQGALLPVGRPGRAMQIRMARKR